MKRVHPACQRSMILAWQAYKQQFSHQKVDRRVFGRILKHKWDLIKAERKDPIGFLFKSISII